MDNILIDKEYWDYMYTTDIQLRYPNESLIRFLKSNFREINKNLKYLDLGCGNGTNGFMAANLGFDVYLIDYSASAIDEAKRTNTSIDNPVSDNQIVVGDIVKELPVPDDYFDVVVSLLTLYHLTQEQLGKALLNIKRKLKKGGVLLCDFTSKESILFKGTKEKTGEGSYYLKNEHWMTTSRDKKIDTAITCSFYDEDELRMIFDKHFSKVKIVKSQSPMAMSLDKDEERTDPAYWIMAKNN